MKLTATLSKNIRQYRKERKLTQEQFAEVLGVTAGAVHKWEAGLSVPELNLIMEMADFFDLSVDALLGLPTAAQCEPPSPTNPSRRSGSSYLL
jgi:transcriptional regulator with XRE-family HTH domain